MQPTTPLLLLLATTALAAPLPSTSTCTAYQSTFNFYQSIFEISVPRPYLGGANCEGVKQLIQTADFDLSTLKCSGTNDNKSTKLTIVSNMKAKNLAKVNQGLQSAYPGISFSCPTSLEYNE